MFVTVHVVSGSRFTTRHCQGRQQLTAAANRNERQPSNDIGMHRGHHCNGRVTDRLPPHIDYNSINGGVRTPTVVTASTLALTILLIWRSLSY